MTGVTVKKIEKHIFATLIHVYFVRLSEIVAFSCEMLLVLPL